MNATAHLNFNFIKQVPLRLDLLGIYTKSVRYDLRRNNYFNDFWIVVDLKCSKRSVADAFISLEQILQSISPTRIGTHTYQLTINLHKGRSKLCNKPLANFATEAVALFRNTIRLNPFNAALHSVSVKLILEEVHKERTITNRFVSKVFPIAQISLRVLWPPLRSLMTRLINFCSDKKIARQFVDHQITNSFIQYIKGTESIRWGFFFEAIET